MSNTDTSMSSAGLTTPATGRTRPEAAHQPPPAAPSLALRPEQTARIPKLAYPGDIAPLNPWLIEVKHTARYVTCCELCLQPIHLEWRHCAHVRLQVDSRVEYQPNSNRLREQLAHTMLTGVAPQLAKPKSAPAAPLVGVEPNPGPLTDKLRQLRFRYHGKYGGPGYSSGEFTDQPDWTVPAEDALDEVFKKHDYDYGKMDKGNADALAVDRIKALPAVKAGVRGQLAALGFHGLTLGAKATKPRYTYPWEEQKLPKRRHEQKKLHHPQLPIPAVVGAGERKYTDPVAATAATMAVEPNPGPPKRRARSTSRKGSRKGTRKPSKKRSRSAPRGSRKQARVRKPRGKKRPVHGTQERKGNTFSRTDLVFSGNTSLTANPGDVVFQCLINPSGEGSSLLPNTRSITAAALNYEAAKWENFDCDVEFIVETNGSKYVEGTFIMGIEMDVTDNTPGGTAGIARMTLQGAKTFPWSSGGRHGYSSINKTRAVKEYWIQTGSSDPRLTAKGLFVLMTNQPASVFNGGTSAVQCKVPVQVFVKYTFYFKNATLEPSPTVLTPDGLIFVPKNASLTPTNTSPFAMGNANIVSAPTYSTALGFVIGNDGTDDYLLFPEGSTADLAAKVLFTGHYEATTSAAVVVADVAGSTSVADFGLLSATSGSVTQYIITLANTTTAISLSTSFTCVSFSPSGTIAWRQNLGTNTFRCWGGLKFHTTGIAGAASSGWTAATVSAYSPSIEDKQLLAAGPGAFEYDYVKSWQWDRPIREHIHRQLNQEHKTENDVEYLKRKLKDLQEEKSLGYPDTPEELSLTPHRAHSTISPSDFEPTESKVSRPIIGAKPILKR